MSSIATATTASSMTDVGSNGHHHNHNHGHGHSHVHGHGHGQHHHIPTTITTNPVISYVATEWGKKDPQKIVEQIGKGYALPTEALVQSQNVKYRSQVIQAGAVDKILEFLLKCNKPFEQVLPPTSSASSSSSSSEGGESNELIECPSIWLGVLNTVCQQGFVQPPSLERDVHYKIIVNIGPLFQDMMDFRHMSLFGKRDAWIKSLLFFCNMQYSLLSNKTNPRLAEFMLKQQHLKYFLVHVLCLPIAEPQTTKFILSYMGKTNNDSGADNDDGTTAKVSTQRPDILGLSQTYCACAIKTLTMTHKHRLKILQEFGSTPLHLEEPKFLLPSEQRKLRRQREQQKRRQMETLEAALEDLDILNDAELDEVDDVINDSNNNDNNPNGTGKRLTLTNTIVQVFRRNHNHMYNRDGWYQGGYAAAMNIFLQLYDMHARKSAPFYISPSFTTTKTVTTKDGYTEERQVKESNCVSIDIVQACQRHLKKYAPVSRDRYFLENAMTGMVILAGTFVTPVMIKKTDMAQIKEQADRGEGSPDGTASKLDPRKMRQLPVDANVAKAIDYGAMELILDACDTGETKLAKTIENVLRAVAKVIILEETCAALQKSASAIKARMQRVMERHPYLVKEIALVEEILRNPFIKPMSSSAMTRPALSPSSTTLLDASTSSGFDGSDSKLDIGKHGSTGTNDVVEYETCDFCQEKAESGKMKRCPFCKSVCYCCHDCQKLNWPLHSMQCEQIRKSPVTSSSQQLHSDGRMLLSRHIPKLLLQASLKGMNILDCFVTFDMCETTPLLKTYTPEQFAEYYLQDEEAVELSRKMWERNKAKGALTVSFTAFISREGLSASLVSFPPTTAPPYLEAVQKANDVDKWLVAQKEISRTSLPPGGFAKIKDNPTLWRAALMKTMKP